MTKTLQERKAEAVKARYEALEKAYDEAEEAYDEAREKDYYEAREKDYYESEKAMEKAREALGEAWEAWRAFLKEIEEEGK